MQTAPSMAAYLAQDKFELVRKLTQTPEVAHSESDIVGPINVCVCMPKCRENAAKFDRAYEELLWRYCGAPVAQKLAPMSQAGVFYVEYINLSNKIYVKLELKALGAKRHLV